MTQILHIQKIIYDASRTTKLDYKPNNFASNSVGWWPNMNVGLATVILIDGLETRWKYNILINYVIVQLYAIIWSYLVTCVLYFRSNN
jgi:hypothetical protein